MLFASEERVLSDHQISGRAVLGGLEVGGLLEEEDVCVAV